MVSLAQLLGIAGQSSGVPSYNTAGIGDDLPGNKPIVVNAPQSLDNVAEIEEAANPSLARLIRPEQAANSAPQRKGLFGMKGTLRDVVGTVGDALLIGAGRNAIYGPGREQERQADALVGLTSNPNAAIERFIYQGGDPRIASQMQEAQAQNVQRQQQALRQEQTAKAQKLKVAQSLMAAAKTPEQKLAVREWVIDPESDITNIPDDLLAASAMNPYQQQQIDMQERRIAQQNDQFERRLAQQESQFTRAEKGRMARDNPPRAESDSDSKVRAGILRKVESGQTLTAGQQKIYDEIIKRPTSGGRRSRNRGSSDSSSPSSGGGKYVIRDGKLVKQ